MKKLLLIISFLTAFTPLCSCVAPATVTPTKEASPTSKSTEVTPAATVEPMGSVITLTPESGSSASGRVTLFSSFDSNLTLSNAQAFYDFDKGQIANNQDADIFSVLGVAPHVSVQLVGSTAQQNLCGLKKTNRDFKGV